jgi:hypothetical protein
MVESPAREINDYQMERMGSLSYGALLVLRSIRWRNFRDSVLECCSEPKVSRSFLLEWARGRNRKR